DILAMQLRRAAFTAPDQSYPMLFVHTGIDADKDLGSQGDSFWWASQKFEAISDPYLPFQKVVRGYDPGRKGLSMNCISATLDGGSGFGGTLVCAGFSRTGDVVELFESE